MSPSLSIKSLISADIEESLDNQVREQLQELISIMSDIEPIDRDIIYTPYELEAVIAAFEVAYRIHIDEKRKTGGKTDERPQYITHPLSVALRLIKQGHDYTTIASALLHDTVETLLKTPGCETKEQCLDYVLISLEEALKERKLSSFLEHSTDIRQIVGALSRDPKDVYYDSIAQIFQLENEMSIMRALLIKCADRTDNVVDTLYYPAYRKLLSVFKTAYVANVTKKYMVTRERFFRRGIHRVKDAIKYFRQAGISFEEVRRYNKRMHQQRAERRYLSDCMRETLNDLVMDSYQVLENVTRELQHQARYRMTKEEREEMQGKFFEAILKRDMYYDRRGFEKVTKPGKNFIYDGTMKRFDGFIRNPETLTRDTLEPEEIYAYALGFKKFLLLLIRPDKPRYFLKGFEAGKF